MVQVLLEGGTEVEQNERYCALQHAVWDGRFDLLNLLIDHGGDVRKPAIHEVFSSWNSDIIGLFIDLGADVISENPLAEALSNRNRIALNVYMKYRDRVPDFKRQLNLALAHHSIKGDKKWVSLMLWAGADPYDCASSEPGRLGTEDQDGCAINSAIYSGRLDILGMTRMLSNPLHPNAPYCFRSACAAKDPRFAALMLKSGHQVNDRHDGTSSLIAAIYSDVPWELHYESHSPSGYPGRSTWHVDEAAVFDFVRLMEKHKACERASLEALFQKGFMRLRSSDYYGKILKMLARLPKNTSINIRYTHSAPTKPL
jgi:hypothetical protein